MQLSAREAWKRILDDAQRELPENTIRTWLEPTEAIALEEDRLVVGAPESSNSNRLVELAEKSGARAHLVQTAADIDPAWLAGVSCVGVTAGASAPEVLVDEVVARLRELAGGSADVASMPAVDEGVVFQLPSELRE